MRADEIRYVIVQAGGRGSRLEHLTANKPKCLLSVDGEPLLYRLFRQLPAAHFIIIADYRFDTLRTYLDVVPPKVGYTLLRADQQGTLAGLGRALAHIEDDNAPFLLMWCDLFFKRLPEVAEEHTVLIGLSTGFPCRWSVDEQMRIAEVPSSERGIAGFFYFPTKQMLAGLPERGEFVRHLQGMALTMTTVSLRQALELGTLSSFESYTKNRPSTRFFNEIDVRATDVVKRSRAQEFDHLIAAEADWYQLVQDLGFQHAPRLRARDPLTIDRIHGRHPFELDVDSPTRTAVLGKIIECLQELHDLESVQVDEDSTRAMYLDKTLQRVERIRRLVPNLDADTLMVNGLRCRNPLHDRHISSFRERVSALGGGEYALIHGDPTFSNMLVDDAGEVWLIDPRGTFGSVIHHGDVRYDWAKLLYSVEGNYDKFNRREFQLTVSQNDVTLTICPNSWEPQVASLRERIPCPIGDIELIHGLIWLALSGYVLDDVDSILGAVYQGVYWLERSEK